MGFFTLPADLLPFQPERGSELMRLPSELLLAILVDLDFRSLLRCRQVCTRFKTLINRDVRAQYKLELAIAGMEDGVASPLTTTERLSALRLRQNAWSTFTWTAKENVPAYVGDVWDLRGNVLAQSEGQRTLHLRKIPSSIRGIESNGWTLFDVGCNITDIAVDPVQDLLLLIEEFENDLQLTCGVSLHLRSLSTGAPHPAAPPTATLRHNPEPGVYEYIIQTFEDYLGVLMLGEEFGEPSELLIWDWKTGELYLHLSDPELYSWDFLTSHSILIAHPGGPPYDVPYLAVIDLKPPSQPPSPVTVADLVYVCTFHYPHLEDNVSVLDINLRSNSHPTPAPGVPFSLSRTDFLFANTLWLKRPGHKTALLLLVPASTFLRARATLDPGETGHVFEWAEWGPHGSHAIEMPDVYSASEMGHVSGTTFTTVMSAPGIVAGEWRKVVVVSDFNQLAARRRVAEAGPGRLESKPGEPGYVSGERKQDGRVIMEPSTFVAGMFKETVTTDLPYVERELEPCVDVEDAEFKVPMLVEDAIVFMTGSEYCIFSF